MDLRSIAHFWQCWWCSQRFFKRLLASLCLVSLTACTVANATPPPTPGLPRQVRIATELRGIAPYLDQCAAENGIALLVDEQPDPLKTPLAEINLAWTANPPGDVEVFQIGVEPVVAVVHPRNEIRAVDARTLQDLLEGKYTHWNELPDQPATLNEKIEIWLPADYELTRKLLEQALPDLNLALNPAIKIAAGTTAMKQSIAAHTGAVGILPAHAINPDLRALPISGGGTQPEAPILVAFGHEPDPIALKFTACLQGMFDPAQP